MRPELDFQKIGNRIRIARLEKGLSQGELGELLNCSNNHISHLETGQTKVSLNRLVQLSSVLNKDFDYFLFETPYAQPMYMIGTEIAEKLGKCDSVTLLTISRIIDVLLEQQDLRKKENEN